MKKLELIKNKKLVDEILTDLDGIRLKALKKFHLGSRMTTQWQNEKEYNEYNEETI